MKTVRTAAAVVLATLGASASAAIAVDTAAFTYAENFDTLASAGGSSAPSFAWSNDATLAGWSLFTSTLAAPPTYRAEIGNQDIGSFTSYGAGGSSERALGAIGAGNAYFGSPASDAIAGYIAVAFTNQTGVSLNSFTVAFAGEQWRWSNAGPQSMVLEYGFGTSFAGVSAWTAPGGNFDWTSPLTGSSALGGIDGNTSGRVAGRGGTATVDWAPDQTLWIRWIERNDAGANHGMGIDDLSFSVTAAPVPEPAAAWLWLGGLGALGAAARRRRS